jgi:hypothetical protein
MQTVYIGNTLINDVFLGSQQVDDVLTKNIVSVNSIRTDAYSASLSIAMPGYLFTNPDGFAQTTYRSDISSYIRGTGTSYTNLAVTGSGTFYMSASNAFTTDGYSGSMFVNGQQNQGAVAANDNNFEITASAFTIECYFNKLISNSGARAVINSYRGGLSGYSLGINLQDNYIRWVARNTAYDTSTITMNTNTWYHAAISSIPNGDTAIFFNGTRVFFGNLSKPDVSTTPIDFLGRADAGAEPSMLFNDFRFYKGISKYSPSSSSITPPPSMIFTTYQ